MPPPLGESVGGVFSPDSPLRHRRKPPCYDFYRTRRCLRPLRSQCDRAWQLQPRRLRAARRHGREAHGYADSCRRNTDADSRRSNPDADCRWSNADPDVTAWDDADAHAASDGDADAGAWRDPDADTAAWSDANATARGDADADAAAGSDADPDCSGYLRLPADLSVAAAGQFVGSVAIGWR